MTRIPYDRQWPDIDIEVYGWSVRLFRIIRKFLKVNIALHADQQIEAGDIFVFNHFSRFETFIPQYLIFEKTGAYCYAIAAPDFFQEDDALSRYLTKVGVIPNDHPRLFPIIATQILHDRKVIIFPEGGMVKDRRVLDSRGNYSIYSRATGKRRKHHTGPAVLAQGLEIFKKNLRNAYANREIKTLIHWQNELGFDSVDQLLRCALKPTLIVPGTITFYPIRSSDNLLRQTVNLFERGLSLRQIEELTIEGNILLKDTDMDLRMGEPVEAFYNCPKWIEHWFGASPAGLEDLDEIFESIASPRTFRQGLRSFLFKKGAVSTRDEYMHRMYKTVTINLSHLASVLIMQYISEGGKEIRKSCFFTSLYIAIKLLQKCPSVNLHRSLLDPEDYENLPQGVGRRLQSFLAMAIHSGLLHENGDSYRFSSRLCEEYDLDTIRLENLIAVYNNEASPIKEVGRIVHDTRMQCDQFSPTDLAYWHFDDECRGLQRSREHYLRPKKVAAPITQKETADADSTPFLLLPNEATGLGVLLIHGLLASPAELRSYGEYLHARGYAVLGVRLKGHGTSPHDLRRRTYEDWYGSVQRNLSILNAFCDRIILIGFSTGGALALLSAAEHSGVKAVVAVAVPIKFRNPAFMLVPLLDLGNKLLAWGILGEHLKPFIENEPEHPRVNYRHVPVRSLFELRRLIARVEHVAPSITQPTLLLHSDEDPVVSPESSRILRELLGSSAKQFELIKAAHHGILMDNSGDTWSLIDRFLAAHSLVPEQAALPRAGA